MIPSSFVFPLRLLGWAALGFALGVGWKLGSHLVNATLGRERLLRRTEEGQRPSCPSSDERPDDCRTGGASSKPT